MPIPGGERDAEPLGRTGILSAARRGCEATGHKRKEDKDKDQGMRAQLVWCKAWGWRCYSARERLIIAHLSSQPLQENLEGADEPFRIAQGHLSQPEALQYSRAMKQELQRVLEES